jgi:hypothetical protein
MNIRSNLEAYHDRELSWWRRRRVAMGLRRSAELRRELDLLQQMRRAASAAEGPPASPDLWAEISGHLDAIDARGGSHDGPAARELPGWLSGPLRFFEWKPIGWVAAAGAAVLVIGLWNTSGPLPDAPAVGALRYLDTSGRSVMVIDEEDVTIIWLMDNESSIDGAFGAPAAGSSGFAQVVRSSRRRDGDGSEPA